MSTGCLRLWCRACAWMMLSTFFLMSLLSRVEERMELERARASQLAIRRNQEQVTGHDPAENSLELETMRDEMHSRRARMLHVCNKSDVQPLKWTLFDDLFLEGMYLDLKNGLVYCSVLKGGSTFWKRMLGITSGAKPEKNPYDIPAILPHDQYLDNLNNQLPTRIDAILDSSVKFMFSREPYSRLFSCYVDKIFTPRPFYWRLRDSILLMARKGWDDVAHGRSCALDVSFAEFFSFVVFSVDSNVAADPHFIPMYQTCRPCDIKYNLLGKMETFWQDANFLLQEQNLGNFTGLTSKHSDLDSIADMVDTAFAEREGNLKCMSFGKVLEIVWKKAVIRGILSKDEVVPRYFLTNSTLTAMEVKAALHDAYWRSRHDGSRHRNRKSAMIQAYQTVSKQDLKLYQKIFAPDFDIFGYEINRPDIFDTPPPVGKFTFFT